MKRRTSSKDRPVEAKDDTSSEMLERLGLDAGASEEQVATAHDAVITFLASAPRDMRSWARKQAAGADEAYAFLSDPTASQDLDALVGSERDVRSKGGGPDDSTAHRPAADEAERADPATEIGEPPSDRSAEPDDDDIDAAIASVTPSAHRDAVGPPGDASDTAVEDGSVAPEVQLRDDQAAAPASDRTLRRVATVAAAVLVLVVVAVAVYSLGAPSDDIPGASDDAAVVAPEPTLDAVKIAALMTRIQEDPTDDDALIGLGDEYFVIGDFTTAVEWFRRALTQEPDNVNAYLALGAAYFNQGDLDGAEMQWLEALRLDPDNLEGHYDLGWVFLNRTPPDMDGLQREWGEVLRLAPDSEVAETVKAHLDALASTDGDPVPSDPPVSVSVPAAASAEPALEVPAAASAEPALEVPVPTPDVSAAP